MREKDLVILAYIVIGFTLGLLFILSINIPVLELNPIMNYFPNKQLR
jgi:hypothetical protein